jgi:outer membrane protein
MTVHATDGVKDELPEITPSTGAQVSLTLDDCVRIAIDSATSVLKAQNSVVISGADLLRSYGQFLPTLTGQANSTYNQGTQYLSTGTPALVHGAVDDVGWGLSADLNLFNGLSDYSGLKSALAKKKVSELSLYRAKQAIALDVSQTFLAVMLDQRLVAFAGKNLQESQARERLLNEQTKVGQKNLSDLFRQQAQTSSDELLLVNADNQRREDELFLLQKLRVDFTKTYHFEDVKFPEEKIDVRFENQAVLLKQALENRADLKASSESANAAHWDVKKQWGQYLPKLDLVAGVNSAGSYLYNQTVNGLNVVPASQSSPFDQLNSQIEYSIGLVLSWTIGDHLTNRQEVETSRALANNADVDAQDSQNQVQVDVRLAYNRYVSAVQRLRASKQGLLAAQKAFEVIEGRYQVGNANFIDLISVQASLLQAESARAQAQIDFVLQGKAIDFAIGETQVEFEKSAQ